MICLPLKNLSVSFIFLFIAWIASAHAQNFCSTEDIKRDNAYYDCICVEHNCLMTSCGIVGSCSDFGNAPGVDTLFVDAIFTSSAVVANEVQASRLKTINSIQEMQKQIVILNTVLNDNYKSHLFTMQKLMLEKINTIARDPSWSQESYEALKLRLLKDLADVFETRNE